MSSCIPDCSAIYKIVNTVDGKVYIGSALHVRSRWQDHRSKLTHNTHPNIKLQRAWNKYGPDAFVFEIVELVLLPEMLTAREQFWFSKCRPFGKRGYNIAPIAGSCLGVKASPETRAKLSAARIGNTNSRGVKHSQETRQKLSKIRTGKPHSLERKQSLSLAKLGKKRDAETVAKMSVGNIYRMKTLIVTAPDGTEQIVQGIRQFCRDHHLDYRALSRVVQGKHSHHKGWKARYAD